MKHAEAVEVAHCGAELEPEVGDVDRRQPPRTHVEDVTERGSRQRLEREYGVWAVDELVCPDDVRMRQAQKEAPLATQPPPRPSIIDAIGTNRLRHAERVPLVAPDVVDVERLSASKVPQHAVPAGESRAFRKRRRRLGRLRHRGSTSERPEAGTCGWCMR